MSNFGKRLKFFRQQQAITLPELALATGLNVATIVKIERRGTRPSLTIVKKMAQVLNVDVALLLGVTE